MMNKKHLLGGIALGIGLFLAVAVTTFAVGDSKTPADGAPAAAQTEPPRDFNDWRLLCSKPDKAGAKTCEMFQRVLWSNKKDAKQKTIALTTLVHTAQVKDKPVTMIRLVTPLGTLLPPGMALKIDDGKEIKVPYTQCLRIGCMVDMVFDKDMMAKMKNGKAMLVAYKIPTGKSNTVQVSLKGFAQAMDAMASGGKG